MESVGTRHGHPAPGPRPFRSKAQKWGPKFRRSQIAVRTAIVTCKVETETFATQGPHMSVGGAVGHPAPGPRSFRPKTDEIGASPQSRLEAAPLPDAPRYFIHPLDCFHLLGLTCCLSVPATFRPSPVARWEWAGVGSSRRAFLSSPDSQPSSSRSALVGDPCSCKPADDLRRVAEFAVARS
jgi:hypothetical protein